MNNQNIDSAVKAAKMAVAADYEKLVERLRKTHEQDKAALNSVIAERDTEISRLLGELETLKEVSKLKSNLFALSDTFHIAAKRIAETENPVEEAATLHELANQLLTVVGLPPRDLKEFE